MPYHATGSHDYEPPTNQQIKERMLARRAARPRNDPRGNPMSETSITDDAIRDAAEEFITDTISNVSYQDVGEWMRRDPRFNELSQDDSDATQTRISDMLSERIITIRWQTYGQPEAAWHTIRRYIGPDLFSDDEIELIDTTHADECHQLPPWAVCWYNHEPHHSWWPAGLGTWRIRPVQWQVAEDDFAMTLEIQAFDEQTQTWHDWDGPTIGELEAAAQTGQEQQR
jgi:hypothetical protein